jgi:hypothetical protein
MTEQADRLSNALADHYRIEHHLGEGGMSTVYLAEDLKHRRKVAVKVLRPELAAGDRRRAGIGPGREWIGSGASDGGSELVRGSATAVGEPMMSDPLGVSTR